MLNIIYGASGIGKKRFIELIENIPYFYLVKKGTNREVREYDGDTLEYVESEEQLRKFYEYVFPYNENDKSGYYFGIKACDVKKAVKDDRHYFLFCNHLDTIIKLDRNNSTNTRAFLFQIDDCEEMYRMAKEPNLQERLERLRSLYEHAREDDNLRNFDGVIFYRVKTGADKDRAMIDVRRQLFSLLETNADCKEYDEATSDKVAVMMPIGQRKYEKKHYDKVFDRIRRTVASFGFEAVRVINAKNLIIDEITDAIRKASIVIVDLSQARPNCYFEAGFAFGAEKKNVLLIKDKQTKVEFDLTGYTVHDYELETKGELNQIVKRFLTDFGNSRGV